MFCWIFPPSPECLICYATSKYPIISLSYAYGCLCHTSHAHTHCLTRLTKCPTCRKRVTTPKLRVDHWIHRALDWIKDNSAILPTRGPLRLDQLCRNMWDRLCRNTRISFPASLSEECMRWMLDRCPCGFLCRHVCKQPLEV